MIIPSLILTNTNPVITYTASVVTDGTIIADGLGNQLTSLQVTSSFSNTSSYSISASVAVISYYDYSSSYASASKWSDSASFSSASVSSSWSTIQLPDLVNSSSTTQGSGLFVNSNLVVNGSQIVEGTTELRGKTLLNGSTTEVSQSMTVDQYLNVGLDTSIAGALYLSGSILDYNTYADYIINSASLSQNSISASYSISSSVLSPSFINVPNGVAGLDNNGNLNATVIPLQDTYVNLSSVVLESGQYAYATDIKTIYFGDGTSSISNLNTNVNQAITASYIYPDVTDISGSVLIYNLSGSEIIVRAGRNMPTSSTITIQDNLNNNVLGMAYGNFGISSFANTRVDTAGNLNINSKTGSILLLQHDTAGVISIGGNLQLATSKNITWDTTSNPLLGIEDTGLARHVAGTVEVNTGTTGVLGNLIANSISCSVVTASYISASGNVTVPPPVNATDAATKAYVDGFATFGFTYYFRSSSADVSGYHNMYDINTPISASAYVYTFTNVSSSQYLTSFISPALSSSRLSYGDIEIRFDSYYNTGANHSVSLMYEIYLRNTASVEKLIAYSGPNVLTGTNTSYLETANLSQSVFINPSDRLVCKVKVYAANNTPDVYFTIDDATSAGVKIPASTSNFVLKSGDVMTGNLTAPQFIGTASYATNSSSSSYALTTTFVTASQGVITNLTASTVYAPYDLTLTGGSSSYGGVTILGNTNSIYGGVAVYGNIITTGTINAGNVTASLLYGTASNSISSSYSAKSDATISGSWASSSLSSSISLLSNTSSYIAANNVIGTVTSSSYALTASYAPQIIVTTVPSSSWASQSLSSSYAPDNVVKFITNISSVTGSYYDLFQLYHSSGFGGDESGVIEMWLDVSGTGISYAAKYIIPFAYLVSNRSLYTIPPYIDTGLNHSSAANGIPNILLESSGSNHYQYFRIKNYGYTSVSTCKTTLKVYANSTYTLTPLSNTGSDATMYPASYNSFYNNTGNGNIGIGTLAPANKLDVVGNISCSVVTASIYAPQTIQLPYAASGKALTPSVYTGSMYIDASNNLLYVYTGLAWKSASLA